MEYRRRERAFAKLGLVNKMRSQVNREIFTPYFVRIKLSEGFETNPMGTITDQYYQKVIERVGIINIERTEAHVHVLFWREGTKDNPSEYSFGAGDQAIVDFGVDDCGRDIYLTVNEGMSTEELKAQKDLWNEYLEFIKNDRS